MSEEVKTNVEEKVKKVKRQPKKKVCPFCVDKTLVIDYKDSNKLRKFR